MRRHAAAIVGLWVFLLGGAATGTTRVDIEIDLTRPGRQVNRLILGSNVQWVDRGDALLSEDGAEFEPRRLALVEQLAPTTLRYPGGVQADHYRWADGVGALAERRPGLHAFSKARQPVLFGTDEFLSLCGRLGAEPLITVNLVTADAAEAARWLAYANGIPHGRTRASGAPKVRFWELGNEPYLIEEGHRELALTPAEYARRADQFASALRAADPSVQIGIALRSDRLGGVPATAFPGFNAKVLAALRAAPDFVALHNAYAPYLLDDRRHSENDMHWALMAAPDQVAEDLAATSLQLRQRWPDRVIPLAITEYAALFRVTPPDGERTGSLAAALFVADLLRVLAERDDVLMAHHWSLLGNWMFGAIDLHAVPRPVFEVLQTYGRRLKGERLPVAVQGPAMTTRQVGMVAARTTAVVTALAVRHGDVVTLFAINKHPAEALSVRIRASESASRVSARALTGKTPFDTKVAWAEAPVARAGAYLSATLLPHSLSVVSIEMDAAR